MTIDYIEKITLQKELKNVKERLKTVQDENAKLKADIDLYRKADAEKTEAIATLTAAVYRLSEEKQQEVQHLQWEKDFLAKQVEHLQSCLDLEKNKD